MSITLNGTTGITTPDIDSAAAPDFDGSNITGIATAAQGALASTAIQPSTSLTAANLTGALPAIDGSALTGIEGVPAGVVIYQAANTAPTGFIKANGASLSTTTYANLFAAIGYTFGGSGSSFNVPDLRGEFMRGWDDSRGIDNSRVFGSSQVDAIKDHEHRVFRASVHGSSNIHYSNLYRGYGYNDFGTSSVANSGRSGPLYSGGGYSETRPRNIALLACIKY
jgi:phage-related tail fiber protein